VELGDNSAAATAKRGKRGGRQASVESVDSSASVASSNQGGRRKKTRGEVTYPGKIPIVHSRRTIGDLKQFA
jgi:hypothetical protein